MEVAEPTVRRRGRKPKAEVQQAPQVQEQEEVTATPVVKEQPTVRKANCINGIRAGKEPIYPFRGTTHLKSGENHYFVNGNPTVGYKLIRVYLGSRNRPHRALERSLKPNKRNERGAKDREIIRQLKEIGVPGLL